MAFDRYWLALGAELAGLATVLAVILGVPGAWILENRRFAGKRTLETALHAVAILPAPLLCYYLLARLAHVFSISRAGFAAAAVISVLPFLLKRSRVLFAALNPAYGRAARSLGVPEWMVFARVELPLAWRPLLGAAAWALALLLLQFAAALWIAEPRP